MRKSLTVVLLTFLVWWVGGCAMYYYQEGKAFEDCKQDYRACYAELTKYADPNSLGAGTLGSYGSKFMDECMKERGYRLVTENELPLRAKRRDPDWWPGWNKRGVAGALEQD
jgi:hypothetical protein